MRRILLAVAAVLLLAGCSSSASKPAAAPTDQVPAATSAAGTATPPAAATKHGIGTALDLSVPKHLNNGPTSIRITLTKVVNPSKPGNQFNEIPAGKHQVALQFQIVDTGKAIYTADPVNRVKIHDAVGQTFKADLTPDTAAGPVLDTDLSVDPGATALGFVTVVMPDGAKIATVDYTATPFGGDTAQWTIG